MKNKGLWTGVFIFFVLFCIDLWTTLRVGSNLEYLEFNPLFPGIGLAGIAVLNFALLGFIVYCYPRTSVNTRYLFLTILVFVSLARIFISINNYAVGNIEFTQQELETIQSTPSVNKIAWIIGFLSPTLIGGCASLITFALFKKDHNINAVKAD